MDPAPPVAPRPALALFDFDGTITTRETFLDFLAHAVSRSRLVVGRLLLAPLLVAYRLGLVPVRLLRTVLVRYAFTGLPHDAVDAAGARLASDVLPGLVRPEMRERIAWHRARGDTVVVVSGGFDAYLAPWCEAQGLDWLCSSLEARDGRLTGRYAGAQCVADEKARRVRARYALDTSSAIHAYGDTHEDFALLALAQHATWRGAPWPGPAPA
ncbi:HAD family hydrolase [Luteimonas deserti]|uniref:HAD family hydrolase n=1 Tax=Luteimonas deserti TaxID=2752306 RepID=A0A7Z0QPW3_9GAMM|nr:HAD family hydrolase [Luteimonas deserti]NYZ61994.1 HAD family hydrolase [Luteimonas deserti]